MKKLLSVLLVLTMIFSLASCNGGKGDKPPIETPEESTPVETPEESTPIETPEESTPVETPEESTPVETPEESTPVETPEESTPVETPDGYTISFATLEQDEKNLFATVNNATTSFSFKDEVTLNGNATFAVSLDEYGMQTVVTKTVSLVEGDNIFYIHVIFGDEVDTYTVTIRRKPMYTVTFAHRPWVYTDERFKFL